MTVRTSNIDLNPLSPQNLEDPHPLFQALRESDPIHFSAPLHGWLVTRYEEVAAVFREPRFMTFKSSIFVRQQLGGDTTEAQDFMRVLDNMFATKDGAEHSRLRRQANPSLANSAVESWRPRVQAISESLLDSVAQRHQMDFIADFAEHLPSRVIAEVYGIPESDRPQFQRWASEFLRFLSISSGDVQSVARIANQACRNLEQYLLGLIEERRQRPGTDIVSAFAASGEQGKMNEQEMAANLLGILSGGHVTTIDQLGNSLYDLLTHPEQLALLRQRPELLRSAVEEMLRYNPAAIVVIRVAIEDTELGGKAIQKGQLVYACTAAANRDPAVFADPERFDITRTNNRHLSFGIGGHLCIGNALARRELEVSMQTLLKRLPEVRLDESSLPKRKLEGFMLRGFLSLPIKF